MPGRTAPGTVPLITHLIGLHGHLHAAPDDALPGILRHFARELCPPGPNPGPHPGPGGPHAPPEPHARLTLSLPGGDLHLDVPATAAPPLGPAGLTRILAGMVRRRTTGTPGDPVSSLHALLLDLSDLLGSPADLHDPELRSAALMVSAYVGWSHAAGPRSTAETRNTAGPTIPPVSPALSQATAPDPMAPDLMAPDLTAPDLTALGLTDAPALAALPPAQRRLLRLGGELARQLNRASRAVQDDLQGQLQRSEAQHRLIVESLNDGVLMLSGDGRIQTLSGRGAELLGIPADLPALDFRNLPWEVMTATGQPLNGNAIRDGLRAVRPGPVTLGLIGLRRPDGAATVWLQVAQRGVTGLDGHPAALLTMTDVTGTRELQFQLDYHALHDAVTGLPNRTQFTVLAGHAEPSAGRSMTVLRLMDGGHVRSLYGDAAFDRYLRALSERLVTLLPPGALLGRVSANTLAFVQEAPGPASPPVTRTLLRDLTVPLELTFTRLHPHLSAGERLWSDDAPPAQALADAEAAARSAAQSGLNRAVIIDQSRARRHTEQLRLGQRLRRDLELGRLSVHYQPVVDLRSGELRSAEALARWTDEERGPVSPSEFIPLALDLNLMPALTRLMLLRAYRLARTTSGALGRAFRVAVNLSAAELHGEDFRERAGRFLAHHPHAAHYLELEVTEQALIQDLPGVSSALGTLQTQGLSVALDDFGTGYSSLAVLQHLPVDKLKIDRSFVQGIEHDARQRLITASVVNLARQLNVTVVAEGVETAAQLQLLREMNCDQVQGFLISRPVSTRQWLKDLRARTDRLPGIR
ncbi:hypothetical protein GCM10008959_28460 [Deinococcus seoulensis]|uniref:EAL domain-containing protein n=2 Tax=Deinococcus seoulensis TaxID=1837379 RepID=A0ABQ2RTK2_9DEIO|nr:hypothetical protein GCM10008959_28460 [Deinococcus seoulensis]